MILSFVLSHSIAAIAEEKGEVCVLPTYTAMLPLRAELAARCGGKEFWK